MASLSISSAQIRARLRPPACSASARSVQPGTFRTYHPSAQRDLSCSSQTLGLRLALRERKLNAVRFCRRSAMLAPQASGYQQDGLSPEQRAFLERKNSAQSGQDAFAPPSSQPSSSGSGSGGLSPEQLAFLERKRGSAPGGASGADHSPGASSSQGLSPQQADFLERRQHGDRASAVAVTPSSSPNGLSPEQVAFMERKLNRKEGDAPVIPGAVCERCNGLGSIQCPACEGTGINREEVTIEALNSERMKSDFVDSTHKKKGMACWLCRGVGQLACPDCGGSGFKNQMDMMGD
eukprot:scaffold626_cov409-Prasinococcus_capsulatus_cf.AAC.17